MNRPKPMRPTGVHESTAVTGNKGGAEPVYGGLRYSINSIATAENPAWYVATEDQMMSCQTLKQLRDMARVAGVPLGKNKREAARNLVGHVLVRPSLEFIGRVLRPTVAPPSGEA